MSPHSLAARCPGGSRGLWFLLLIVLLASMPAKAAALILDDAATVVMLQGLELVEDPGEQLRPEEVAGLADDQFRQQPVNLGYRSGAVWARLQLDNRSGLEHWWLQVGEPRLQTVEVFQQSASGWQRQRSGVGWPMTERAVVHREHLFPISLPIGQSSTILIRVASETSIALPIRVAQPQKLLASLDRQATVLGLSLGLVAGIGAFYLLVFALMREAVHGWFGLSALGLFAYTASYEGLAALYLGHWLGAWVLHPILVMALLTQVALIRFSLAFIRPGPAAAWMVRALHGVTLGHLVLVVLVLLVPYTAAAHLVSAWTVPTAVLLTAIAGREWWWGNPSMRFFCVGFGLFWIVVIITLLEIYGLLPIQVGPLGRQLMWLGTVPVIAAAFADRQRRLGRERDEAQHALLAAERDMVRTLEVEVRHRTRDMEQALRSARAAAGAKDQFLATVSHELRTPLVTLAGTADLLQQTIVDPEQRDLLAAQRRAGAHLLGLVDDLLALSRLEHGDLVLYRMPFSPRTLLDDLVQMLRPQAEAKGLTLRLECEVLPAAVVGDPERLHQVMSNLVVNAIKYTASGGVLLRARSASAEDGAVTLVLVVEDTGEGMDSRLCQIAFQPFEQGRRGSPGIGLGLAIVSRLVRAMGGRVDVESEPGLGSCFRVQIPFPLADAELEQPSRAAADVRHLLLVEDVPENRMLLCRQLQHQGYQVTAVRDGASALETLGQQAFDAVLLDLGLPDMDGSEVARRIRACADISAMPRLIALTAQAPAASDASVAPFDALLHKPLEPARLRQVLQQTAVGSAPSGAPMHSLNSLPAEARAVLEMLHERTCREVAQSLQEALGRGDHAAVAAAAHRLAGSALQMGQQVLARLAQDVEQAARQDDMRPARALLAQLSSASAKTDLRR